MDLSDALQGHGSSPIFDELLGPCKRGATRGCGYVKRVKKSLLKMKIGYVVVHRKSMQVDKLPLFEELFTNDKSKLWYIITFMALLEMAKLRLIKIVQLDQHGAIHCTRHEDFDQNINDWYNLQKDEEQKEESPMLKAS